MFIKEKEFLRTLLIIDVSIDVVQRSSKIEIKDLKKSRLIGKERIELIKNEL